MLTNVYQIWNLANPGPGFYQLPSTFGEIQSIR